MTADELARVKALHARLVEQAQWTRPDPEIRAGITVGLDAQALGECIADVERHASELVALRAAHSGLVRDYETRGWMLEMEASS